MRSTCPFRQLILSGFLLGSLSAFAQREPYDPSKLSPENRRKIEVLETFVRDSITPGSDIAGMLMESKMYRLKCTFTTTETASLVNHPVAQIRQHFVDWYVHDQLKTGTTDRLFDYLNRYWTDTTQVDYSTGCILNTSAFGDYAFNRIYNYLDASQQRQMRVAILEAALPMAATETVMDALPFSDSSYAVLERLVYEKHLFPALGHLLSYEKPKDADAVLLFTSTNRREAHYIMADHFRESYTAYLEAAIPELLTNTWKYDSYRGYAMLLGKCQPETTSRLLHNIQASFGNDRIYRCAEALYSELKDSIPAAERDSFLLDLFPSLGIMDTTDAGYLRRNYPDEFDRKLEQRFLLAPCPDDYSSYSDSAYTRFMLRDYTAQSSAHKMEFYRKLIRIAQGPPLMEAVVQLKATYPEEVAVALEEHYSRMVTLQMSERPGLSYGRKYGLEPSEGRGMESLEKAIIYLDNPELKRRTAQAIAGYYGNEGTDLYDTYAIALLNRANDPALYEQLLQKVESRPYIFSYRAIIDLLLDLGNPAYDQRLKQRYLQLQKTGTNNDLHWFRQVLVEQQLLPPGKSR